MKPVSTALPGHWSTTFFNGTVITENTTYATENVSSGPVIRVDPRFHKLAGSWWYYVVNDVNLHSGGSASWNWRQTDLLTNRIDATKTGVHGWRIPDPTQAEVDFSSVGNQALSRLNDSVRGNLDLSIALAEAGKTAQMVTRVAKVLSFARSKKPRGGYPIPGPLRRLNDASYALANGYLEFKYGWKPLLSDVFNAADESIRCTLNQLQRFRASASVPLTGAKTVYTSIGGPDTPIHVEWAGGRLSTTYSMVLRIPDSSFDIARWSSLNPLTIGWELIPYSFVVDWFVGVGSYLRNVETALYYNTQFVSGYRSDFCFWPFKAKLIQHTSFGSGKKIETQDLIAFKSYVQFNRSVLQSYPSPSLPHFRADLGASQLTSAAALLRQLLRRA